LMVDGPQSMEDFSRRVCNIATAFCDPEGART